MIEEVDPVPEQSETSAEKYVDPYGPGPGIPDPMPTDLQPTPEIDKVFADPDGMAGEAPTS